MHGRVRRLSVLAGILVTATENFPEPWSVLRKKGDFKSRAGYVDLLDNAAWIDAPRLAEPRLPPWLLSVRKR